jgi:HAD superfamily hydrolase (TIGR01509 family)
VKHLTVSSMYIFVVREFFIMKENIMVELKNKFKAIIFDMDGTIIRSEDAWFRATKKILIDRNFITLSEKQIQSIDSMPGIGLIQSAELLKRDFKINDSVETLVNELKLNAIEQMKTSLSFIEGFENFHTQLQIHNIPTSIATNADPYSLQAINNQMNLSKFFGAHIYHIGHVENKVKPDPAIFLHAAEKLNVNPSECIVFEDSIFGFEAAKQAGMKCVAIQHPHNENHRHEVHGSITSYDDALNILKKI